MDIEHIYRQDPDLDAPHKAVKSTLFLQKLITVLQVISWIGIAIFGLVFLCSVLGVIGIEQINSRVFDEISPVATMISSLSMLIGTGVFLIILKQLRQICQTLIAGDPFVPQNAKRLRIIWIAVAAAEIFRLFSGMFLSGLMHSSQNIDPNHSTEMSFDLRVSVWFLVLAFIIFAEVFREGARLRHEQQYTV